MLHLRRPTLEHLTMFVTADTLLLDRVTPPVTTSVPIDCTEAQPDRHMHGYALPLPSHSRVG